MYFFQAGMAAGQADVERGGGEDEMGWCSFYFLMRYFQREKERIKRELRETFNETCLLPPKKFDGHMEAG